MQVQQISMKISGKGQVVIPVGIRRRFGWKPGMRVVIDEAHPTRIVLKKKKAEDLVEKYVGSMKGKIPSIKRYLEMKKEELKLEE